MHAEGCETGQPGDKVVNMMRDYSLIDGALVYETLCAHSVFVDPAASWYVCLLPGEERRLAGPILIDMALLDAAGAAAQSAVAEVMNAFPGKLHSSLLQSEADLISLANHLQRFTCFYDENFLLLGFRFADTRILAHLPSVLTPQQWGEMTSLVGRWVFLDRRGEEVVLALPEDRESLTPENKQFKLSSEQLEVLIDAAEPDMLLDLIKSGPRETKNHLYDDWNLAQNCVSAWQQSGSRNREVLLQFAKKIFNSNGQALQKRDWISFLARAKPQDVSNS